MAELNINVALKDLSLPDGQSTIYAKSFLYPEDSLIPSENSGAVTYNTEMLEYERVGSVYGVKCINGDYTDSLTSVAIPTYYLGLPVREILDGAFTDNKVIQSVTIPNSIRKIGDSAFKGCTSLSSVSISSSDQVVVYFRNSLKWSNVRCYRSRKNGNTTVPVNTWPGDAMQLWSSEGDEDIYRLAIGKGTDITFVGMNSDDEYESTSLIAASELIMNGCWEAYIGTDGSDAILARTYFYDDATASLTLGTNVFEGCTSLISIHLPDTINYVPDKTFLNCTSLTRVLFASTTNLIGIGESAFAGTKLTDIDSWPQTIRNIGQAAFMGCTDLTFVKVPQSVIAIERAAFATCTGITAVNIDSTTPLTNIGEQAFYNCNKLDTISIPETVIGIGANAFTGCPLASVTMYDPYGWFDVIDEGREAISYHDLKKIEEAGNCLKTTHRKYKIDQLETPVLDIDATTLYITDPTGMAEAFEIWVIESHNESHWATVDAQTGAVTLVKE